jgi:hypothetical protein
MQLSDALSLISSTFCDRLYGSVVFQAPGNQSLRAELAVDGGFFRVQFLTGDGRALSITPGSVVALLAAGNVQLAPAATDPALTAWQSQPPITFAPLAAGLSQLTTGVPQIDSFIAELSQFNGTLAFAFLPDVCWFEANYAQILVPGLQLNGVSGGVCLRDITIGATSLSFNVEIGASLDSATVSLGTGRQVVVQKLPLPATARVSFKLRAFAFLDTANGKIAGELVRLAATAPSGTVQFDDYLASGFAASLQVQNLEFEGDTPTRGFLRAALQPQPGGKAIALAIAKPLVITNLTLANFTDASFQTLALLLQYEGAGLRPAARLDLTHGQLLLNTIGVQLAGQPGLPDNPITFTAPPGSPFTLGVTRLAYILSEDGSTAIRLAASFVSPSNLMPQPALVFGFTGSYTFTVPTLGKITLNGWSVGECDWRFALSISDASGVLQGPGSGDGSQPVNIPLTNILLQIISDEFAPCPPSEAVIRRHAFGEFAVTIANLPKSYNGTFSVPQIPVSPDAIIQTLQSLFDQKVSSGVLQLLASVTSGILQAAFAVGGVVGIDAYLIFDGSYQITFDPNNSTSSRLRFRVDVLINVSLRIRLYGQLGICPVCIAITILDKTMRVISGIALSFTVDLFWQYNVASNSLDFTHSQVAGGGILGIIVDPILQDYVDQAIQKERFDLPPEFSLKKLLVHFKDPTAPTVTISVTVGVEMLDWVES